ncbi:MAG: methyltransferase domain-containing protein [bacterium]|nr:methyltransferase domain-containing protein [bacterium]
MKPEFKIPWENYSHKFLKELNVAPGAANLASALISALEPEQGQHWLDFCPGPEILAAIIAKEFGLRVTSLVQDPRCELRVEDAARELGVSDLVNVIPGEKLSLPVPSEEFDRIFCLGNPFFTPSSSKLADELLRVIKPGGMVGFAGPTSLQNDTPKYMENGLLDFHAARLRTPAWTALQYSKEGFHIAVAEYIHGTWDLWKEWLDIAPKGLIPDSFRKAVIEDEGRWLSLGVIVLRKPPRPNWAL